MNETLNSDESTNHDKEEEAVSEIDMAIKLETNLIEGDESELVVVMPTKWTFEMIICVFFRLKLPICWTWTVIVNLNWNQTMTVHRPNMISTKM